jgi:oxygen-independent coproporphyrinogen-3 oxidase
MPSAPPELIRRFGVCGPRYTSYPTTDRFVEAFTPDHLDQALAQRRDGAAAMMQPLALYAHIPFCESLCYYCNCDKTITRQHEHGEKYLRYLRREVDLYTAHFGAGRTVTRLHLGGGTPTFLSDSELCDLMLILRAGFAFDPSGEYSIEVDPRSVDGARLATLRELGLNRLSLGVQDFDPAVQKAVHRVQSTAKIFALVASARALGFESISVDLIHGLPRQTPESLDRTLAQLVQLRPDRIALHAYTHLPERFKPQRRISAAELPTVDARVSMLTRSLSALERAGYVHLGMGEFALPDDALAVAKRQGRLHRGFQGYSAHPDCDLIGLGVSAMGRIGAACSQNARTLEAYCNYLDQGRLPVARGLALSRDDLVRRAVIMALMCQGQLQFESIELSCLIDFNSYFAAELNTLRIMQAQGLVKFNGTGIEVTPMGGLFACGVAMVFDRYLQADHARARFSRIL